jgi:hypothetical protein
MDLLLLDIEHRTEQVRRIKVYEPKRLLIQDLPQPLPALPLAV